MREISKNAYYEISADPAKNRLFLKIIGFWKNRAQVPNYLRDIEKASKELSKGFTIVSDLREMKAPDQEIGTLHEEAQTLLVRAGLDKTAEVHTSAIAKMFTQKYSNASQMKKQVFSSIAEGEKWLES